MIITTTKKIILLFFLCGMICGCGGGVPMPDDMPAPQETIIKVTSEGQPLSDASVTLMPLDVSSRWYAGAVTDSAGNAVIYTISKYRGAVPGKYKITVAKRETMPSSIVFPDQRNDPNGYAKAVAAAAEEVRDSFDLIDPKLGSVNTTPEEIEIVTGKNNKTIEVGKPVRIKIGN
ncbi:MAG: carboxypeptidase-like regulatory domain-containing protein [Planctomycetaceae bacterium]|jgi:hypothetical protein|nr:carboxypeptidase-like regulatory domain-containing protein [Planctomycetaceae bacterium]